jgi:hypothetical protein
MVLSENISHTKNKIKIFIKNPKLISKANMENAHPDILKFENVKNSLPQLNKARNCFNYIIDQLISTIFHK